MPDSSSPLSPPRPSSRPAPRPSLTRLPPLSSLRTFLVAAQHLNFARAAQELNVTPAAVGQQIRLLESHLGRPLFLRQGRVLRLTEDGSALLPGLREGFGRIVQSVADLSAPDPGTPLTVSVPPSFATKWLVPRLERYKAAHPGQDVRIVASMALADLSADGVDCAIRYGGGVYPGVAVERLLTEAVIPVCSPTLMAASHPPDRLETLRHHTLLHDDSPDGDASCPDWRMWLRAAGINDVNPAQGLRFDQSSLVLEAALAGQGVALAKARLADADLRAGRLVQPFGQDRPSCRSQGVRFAYYLLCVPDRAGDPRVRAFRDWLRGECGTEETPPSG
ncbi:LysR family glycine cleavage system transcriptional activator [Azospirillum agricola]|uniref:transcriptional regulator GcvA n=1 Tax=Azospirillum agricola TaxID=1720247 RepID=UPI001AE14E8C|nr:transcriptional regulator GcvA [Azospirillum agricola]MBP2231891.1 LysR family glycine cleavage system transcriptional activator [Azospirillum agricola]